jgi:arsenite methyltransferase
MDEDTKKVQKHYAEVAKKIRETLPANVANERSSCEACEKDAPLTRNASEQDNACDTCKQETTPEGDAGELYDSSTTSKLPQAALLASRGCGDPVSVAGLKPGMHVLDLGSGGGIDALIASELVGVSGHVYGVDMTQDMIELAKENAKTAGTQNVSFLQGQIEDTPLPDECVDVVISNCVINLSTNKPQVLREAYRVLKPGGYMVVSDIVAFAPIPKEVDEALRHITGCLNGMQETDEYLDVIKDAGFKDGSFAPKTTYTSAVLLEKASRKNRMEWYAFLENYGLDKCDSICGSAIVRAYK